jgi:hypothetical protein
MPKDYDDYLKSTAPENPFKHTDTVEKSRCPDDHAVESEAGNSSYKDNDQNKRR